MPLPVQSDLGWKVSICLVTAIAIGFTLIRLWDRFRKRALWWDDYITVFPLITTFLYVLIVMIKLQNGVFRRPQNFFFSTWWSTFLFYTSIWVSRISLCLSVARVFPKNERPRQVAFALAFFFFWLYFASIIIAAKTCHTPGRPWYQTTFELCTKTKNGVLISSIIALAFDFTADVLLVVFPIVVLRKVRLPSSERRLILVLFGSSIISFCAAIYFEVLCLVAAKIGPSAHIMLSMASLLQGAISLLVCNILIVTMALYRLIRKIREVHEAMTAPASKRGIAIPIMPESSTTERPETKSSDLRSGVIPPISAPGSQGGPGCTPASDGTSVPVPAHAMDGLASERPEREVQQDPKMMFSFSDSDTSTNEPEAAGAGSV